MPVLSEDADEGVLVTWFVAPGAAVREGDLLAEVQVEKVSAEVHAPADGRMELLVPAAGVVRQGAAIAVLETGATAASPPTSPPPVPPASAAAVPSRPASPAARRLARELGVDISEVAGSGPGGRIVEDDVRAAVDGGAPSGAVTPLSPMRRAIAQRLTSGLATAAQLTLTAEADVTDLAAGSAPRTGYTEAVVRAVALAAREHGRVVARWADDGLVAPATIDVAVAVAVEDGLMTPVVRAADGKDLPAIAAEIAELAARARDGDLAAAEMAGAGISVTNLGAHRIDAFTPLLDPPQTATLGVGRARLRPAVVDGEIVPRRLMTLSLTFDHRVLDGEPAAAFLDAVIARLERPALLDEPV